MRKLVCMASMVAVLGLSGCGGEEPAGREPASARDQSGPETTDSASTPATSGPAEATPSIEPADGKLVETEHMSFHLPEGWEITERALSTIVARSTTSGDRRSLTASVFPTSNTTKEIFAIHLETLRNHGKVRRLPPIELLGCTAYQTTAFDRGSGEFRYDVGCSAGLQSYAFTFWENEGDLGRARQVAGPVLASLQLG